MNYERELRTIEDKGKLKMYWERIHLERLILQLLVTLLF